MRVKRKVLKLTAKEQSFYIVMIFAPMLMIFAIKYIDHNILSIIMTGLSLSFLIRWGYRISQLSPRM